MRIKMAVSDLVDEYQLEVKEVLTSLGHPGALVTDLSTFYDFTTDPSYFEDEIERQKIVNENESLMKRVRSLCGPDIQEQDTLVSAAKSLRDKRLGDLAETDA